MYKKNVNKTVYGATHTHPKIHQLFVVKTITTSIKNKYKKPTSLFKYTLLKLKILIVGKIPYNSKVTCYNLI